VTGVNFKYEYSYEELGLLIQTFVSAWRVEIEKYFSLVVFNFLFSNGDAHLKNFSLLESSKGDYFLSPAYDLINTRLHVDDVEGNILMFTIYLIIYFEVRIRVNIKYLFFKCLISKKIVILPR